MSKYTAGKWNYSDTGGTVFVNGKGIAKVYEAASLLPDYTEEGAANARLIAAAPEMYEALTTLLEELPIIAGDSRHDALALAMHEAQQLIARIDGEEGSYGTSPLSSHRSV